MWPCARATAVCVACCALMICAQDCFESGEHCVDSGQCCGGCCFDAVCISTYRLCTLGYDVCDGHSCIDEQNCRVYIPPQCPGCEAMPVCQ